MGLKYPKHLMTRRELIDFGVPKCVIDRALKSKYQPAFAMKSGDGRTSKWYIVTDEFEWFRTQGVFK